VIIKSFSLFETLIALVVLSIIISGFIKIFNQSSSYKTYNNLQIEENNFYKNEKINYNI
jgi:Tfp pilus assembly protein PilV